MTERLQLVRRLFVAALAKLAKEGCLTPTAWEAHNLTTALSAISGEDLDKAVEALRASSRRPLASEIAQLPFSKGRATTSEINKAFGKIKWML